MATTEITTGKKKDEKKPQITVKLDWIFGIRKDIIPNVAFMDKNTIIYPASNYIVIFNFTRNMGLNNLQHYIGGHQHSKGITAFACSGRSKKYIGFSEDLEKDKDHEERILISFYALVGRAGFKNYPQLQNTFEFTKEKLTHTYCIAFSRMKKEKDENYIVALASSSSDYYFIVWKWDLENIKENVQPFVQRVDLNETRPLSEEDQNNQQKDESSSKNLMNEDSAEEEAENLDRENINEIKDGKIEVNTNYHFQLEFSNTMDNDTFSLVSRYSVTFFTIADKQVIPRKIENKNDNNKDKEEDDRIDLMNKNGKCDLGSKIYGSSWLFDGAFCLVTDKYINIFDGKDKKNPQKIENPDGNITIVTPYTFGSNNLEGFIAAGKNKTMQFYSKKTVEDINPGTEPTALEKKDEKFDLVYEKTKYDFVPGVNEKITDDKVLQNEKISSNDRQFEFLTIIIIDDEDPYCIATTSNNDLLKINTEEKEIDRALIQYLITPFHSDSIEGMDVCINKPYIITCSKDKSVRVWDYNNKIHVISKMFDEELHSIAYHPSGMHALVSADDKILPLNIFYDEIDTMAQNITTKSKSKDIKFSNMGHLFAFDSGTAVQIYDFLNMQIFMGPPPSGAQKRNFSTTSNKINYLNWGEDDKYLLVSGNEYMYEWEIKEEHEMKPKIPGTNITSSIYCDRNRSIIASTDGKCLQQLAKDSSTYIVHELEYPMNELHAFKKSKIIICATTRTVVNPENVTPENNVNNTNKNFTTCLRVFPETNRNFEYFDYPAHQGKTTRVRFNFQENRIFTCGEDGCINIYSIEIPFDNNESEKYLSESNSTFTSTVLIKRGEFKIREFNKKELPAKREEKLKKIRSENNDKREADKKLMEEKKTKITNTKHKQNNKLEQMRADLQNTDLEYNKRIKEEVQANNSEHETQFNNNQIELSVKTREVENIRVAIKAEKDKHKKEVQTIQKEFKEYKDLVLKEFEAKKKDLEGNKMELDGKIKSLKENQIEDNKALEWLNVQVITEIKENIDELRHKIDELKVHYTHHIKKQKEEKEKLQQTGENLSLEIRKIEEEKDRQQKAKQKNLENRKKADEELIKMTKRISEIENKIIECKKAHTYLEKCKFVLSYKIQELKKEAGPMEKVLEDLQLRTKEDELSLSKYNREFEIIEQKLVNLEDLKEKTKTHEKTEHDLKNEINAFKIDLFNMLPFIDDYDKLREGFRNMRDKYLKSYVPELQDHELESEFSNQKSKMKNRVLELQSTLNTLKQQHKENIFGNRYKNNEMIQKIEELKESIKKTKKENETKNGDQKHANAVAEIFASQAVKKLMMENISIKDKIQVFEEKIRAKKEELNYLKRTEPIKHVYLADGYNVNEEANNIENNNNNNINQEENEDGYM